MGSFEIVMRAYTKADVYNLIGSYITDILQKKFPSVLFGLDRDDTPAISRGVSSHN